MKTRSSRGEKSHTNEALTRARETIAQAKRMQSASGTQLLEQLLEKYNQALVDFRLANQTRDQANTLKEIGDLMYQADKQQASLNYYKQALRLSRATGHGRLEVQILVSMADANAFLGRNQSAVDIYQQARELSRKISDQAGEARATGGLGEAYYNLSDARAAQYLEQALDLWGRLDDPRGRAQALRYLGYLQTDLSNLPLALDYYNRALALFQAAHDLRGEAQTINAIALVHTLLGERDLGVEDYDKAQDIFRKIGDLHGLATALNGKGNLYAELDLKLALDCHTEALTHSEHTGKLDGQIISHRYLGSVYRALGEAGTTSDKEKNSAAYYDRAIEHFERSLQLSRMLGDRRIEAYCLQDLAGVYDFKGDTKRALDYYQRSLVLSRRVKDVRGQALILNRVSEIHGRLKDWRGALLPLRLALPLTRAAEDQGGESMTLYNIARIKHAEGDTNAAIGAIEDALKIVESLRGRVPGYNFRSSYSASVYRYYQLKIDLLMDEHRRNPGAALDLKALEQTEVARARSLIDMLSDAGARIRSGVSPNLLDEERSLQQSLNMKADHQANLVSGAHTEEQAAAAEKEIRELTAKYENVQAQIRRQSPHYAALMEPQPLSVREIQQKVLDDNSILLEYFLGDERSFLWAVTRTEVTSYQLPGRAEIENSAREIHSILIANQPLPDETFEQQQGRVAKANGQLPSQIAKLSRILLGPVVNKLGTKRLLIVPDGALQYIPFQILNTASGPRPLVADHEIVNEPSASTLALLVTETKARQPASRSVAVLADPVFEADDPRFASPAKPAPSSLIAQVQDTELHRALRDVSLSGDGRHIPRLLASRAEADAIMSVTPWRSGFQAVGFEASRATAMRTDLGDYRIVHFATHGLLNNEHPELSGIVLSLFNSKGEPQDGFLRLHDIYNLKLPVDLVVLSACNTGLGKDVRGEGLIGLTRGFMYAGASSVVASLWKVDDEATAELMRLFYGYMLRDGLSPAAALRKAQVTMSQQKRWQSPYYWAGFVIQGQYIQKERSSRLPIPQLALWLFGAVVVTAAAFYALKRRRKITL